MKQTRNQPNVSNVLEKSQTQIEMSKYRKVPKQQMFDSGLQ